MSNNIPVQPMVHDLSIGSTDSRMINLSRDGTPVMPVAVSGRYDAWSENLGCHSRGILTQIRAGENRRGILVAASCHHNHQGKHCKIEFLFLSHTQELLISIYRIGFSLFIMSESIQNISAFPRLLLVKKRYLPSRDILGQISPELELTLGPMFLATVQLPSS